MVLFLKNRLLHRFLKGLLPLFVCLVTLGFSACDTPSERGEPSPERVCNGSTENCQKVLSDVSIVMTHNSMSSEESGFFAPNQYEGLVRQLSDGVRGINWDVYDVDGRATLCHGICSFGNRLMVDALGELKIFLEEHPTEVITIIFESYVSAEMMRETFEEAELLPLLYAHDPEASWPTLDELTESGTPLILFTDSGGDIYPWLHNVWSYAFETPYAAETPDALSCALNRGNAENPFFILPHFLTAPLAAPELADQINHNPFFQERINACTDEWAHRPTIIQVDFYSVGDVFDVVEALND